MTPEQRGNAAEQLNEIPIDLRNALVNGKFNVAHAMLPEEWFRRNASDPQLREAAATGVLRAIEGGWGRDSTRIRELVGLRAEDFQIPDVRRFAQERVRRVLEQGYGLDRAAKIEDLARLGPEFYADEATRASLTTAIRGAIKRRRDPGEIYDDLSPLPIPEDFNLRELILAADRECTLEELTNGTPEILETLRDRGRTAEERADPAFQRAARDGAENAIRYGTVETFLGYAELFGIDPKDVAWDAVLKGYCNLIRANRLADAAALLKRCPQLTDALRIGPELTSAVFEGSVVLATDGHLSDADDLMRFGKISPDEYEQVVRTTVQKLFQSNMGTELAKVVHHWRVPPSVVRAQGASFVRAILANRLSPNTISDAWGEARRIQAMARLPRREFEDALIGGVVNAAHNVQYDSSADTRNLDAYVKNVLAIRLRLPIGPDVADRLEASAANEAAAILFRRGKTGRLDQLRQEFPSLDNEAIRRAAVDGTNRILQGGSRDFGDFQVANDWLAQLGQKPVAWDDVRARALECAESLLIHHAPAFFSFIHGPIRIPDAELATLLRQTRDDAQVGMLFREDLDDGAIRRFFALYGFSWKTFPLKHIPLQRLLETEDPELIDRAKADPWLAALTSLRGIQARSANPDHDPWILELFPMVERLTRQESILSRESERDGRLLVDYVTTFGMFDMQRISRIYFGLRRGPFASLPADDRTLLIELVGPKASRLESAHLINELRKLRFDFQRDLLRDKIPHRLETTLGEEAFAAIRGTSDWSTEDRPADLFAAWKETVAAARAEAVTLEQKAIRAVAEGKEREATDFYARADAARERVSIAPGYEEISFAVPRTYRGKDGASAEEELDRLRGEVPGAALAEIHEAGEIAGFATRCPEWLAMSNESQLQFNRDPIYELRARLDDARQYDPGISVPTVSETESFFRPGGSDLVIARMEAAAEGAKDAGRDRYLLALSAVHVAIVAPAAWTQRLVEDHRFEKAEAEVRERAAFLSEYLREHYLNPAQDPGHTGHAAFSERLLRALARAWHAGGDAATNPILRSNAGFEALSAKRTRLSTDTANVTLVPVRGPLSIYSGDIGSACYSNKHDDLARGKFPSVRAMVFVTNRDKPAERLAGSVLFVETRLADSNERILVIRANNPRENLVAQLDAASLVRQTVDAAIATARRRKIKRVGVVRDNAGGASSNRESVARFYANAYDSSPRATLANEPATNFNGYNVWDPNERHPTVVVWTNDDPETT